MQRRRGLRRRSAVAPRPRPNAPASTLPWTPFAHDVEEPKRGAAFQKPMAVKLGVFRPVTVYPFYEAATSAHWGQTPREAMAESGELWSTYSERRLAEPQRLAEAALHAGRNYNADAGQPPDRLALYKTDGGQSDRQYGRGGADDQPCESTRRRHSGGSPGPRLGRRIGGRAARLSDPRPVFREPSAERRAQGGDGSRRRRRQGVRRHRALQLLSLRAEDGAADARARAPTCSRR